MADNNFNKKNLFSTKKKAEFSRPAGLEPPPSEGGSANENPSPDNLSPLVGRLKKDAPPPKLFTPVKKEGAPIGETGTNGQAPPAGGKRFSWRRFSDWRWLAAAGLIVVIILFLLFFGARKIFFKQKPAPAASVTLNYWGLWEPDGVIQGIIAQFEKENPNIKINYKFNSKKEYKARLQNSLARGQGPDIFRFHQSWLPIFKNQLSPVPSSVAGDLGLEKNYFAIVPRSLKLDGKFYAIPLMVDNLALFYNKPLLSAAGEKPPRTWWGLEETAKKMTTRDDSGRIKIAGAALGTTGNVDHWSDILGLMLIQNGVDLKNPEKDQKLIKDVLQFYTLFYSRDQVWNNTLPSSTMAFATNKLVFYFAPSWRIFNLLEINPRLDFGIAPVPKLPKDPKADFEEVEKGSGQLAQINWSSFWAEGVWAKSRHRKEAWRFLQFLSSPKNLTRFYQAASQVRDFGEIYPVKNLAESLKSNPRLATFVNQADTSYSWYLSSSTYDDGPNDIMINYFADAVNAIDQGTDPAEATATLLQGVSQVKSRYHLP